MNNQRTPELSATFPDVVFLSYLRSGSSEGYAADALGMDRLEFREALATWLKSLMDASTVLVEGWHYVPPQQE